MQTITVNDLATDLMKYLTIAKTKSLILNDNDESYTFSLKLRKPKAKPVGRHATPEEIELFRQGRENFAKGNYYAQRDGETVREFTERILREDD